MKRKPSTRVDDMATGTREEPLAEEAMVEQRERLEYLRDEFKAERMSYGELSELQDLAEYIDPGDNQLLEAAGVPEFPPDDEEPEPKAKRLPSVENDQVSLEVMECVCGFHMGLDATYMDQVADFTFRCPSCDRRWNTADVFPETES